MRRALTSLNQDLLLHAAPGEGTTWSLDHSWAWAPWITLLLLLFSAVWVWYFYARESGSVGRRVRLLLATLRFGVILLLFVMIAQILVVFQRTGLPVLVVALDRSASMGIVDHYDDESVNREFTRRLASIGMKQPSRFNLARLVLLAKDGEFLSSISGGYRLRLYFIGDEAQAQTSNPNEFAKRIRASKPDGQFSRLGSGIRTILSDLRGSPPAAIILLTDGINTDGQTIAEAASYARRKRVPLFTIGLGSEEPVRDAEVTDLLVDEFVFVDDVVNFQATFSSSGLDGREAVVVLKQEGSDNILAQRKIMLEGDGKKIPLRIPYRPTEVGRFQYVVEILPLQGELHSDNNRQQRVVEVRKEQIRVLLVQGYPNYEFRYLKNLLQRDSTIQLNTVLQEADLRYAEQDESALRVFPVRREDLMKFDVILFGDVNPAFLSTSAMANLHDFVVQKGGGMVFMAGTRYTPLAYQETAIASLLPIDFNSVRHPGSEASGSESFVVQPTDLGLASPHMQLGDSVEETRRIWQQLPSLNWLLEVGQLKPAAQVLAEHPSRTADDGSKLPIFCMQYVGAGKVLFHATDETWRWRWQLGDVLFARYWVQSIRFLARAKLLGGDRVADLTVDRREYRRGEPVQLRVRFLDERAAPAVNDGVTVMIEQSGQKNRRMRLHRQRGSRGVFEGVFHAEGDGAYHVWMVAPTVTGNAPSADFLVAAPPGEFERLQMDGVELARAADQSRGKFYRIHEASRLLKDLPRGRQIPVETLPPQTLWNHWAVLCLLLLFLVSEWLLRKRFGLL